MKIKKRCSSFCPYGITKLNDRKKIADFLVVIKRILEVTRTLFAETTIHEYWIKCGYEKFEELLGHFSWRRPVT